MITRMNHILHQAYRVPDVFEQNKGKDSKTLILTEDCNVHNSKALYKIKLHTRRAGEFAVYKFDQKVTIERESAETYAPFLQPGEARAMCDFIIFFNNQYEPEKLCAWVVNLKSGRDGNNVQQMRAGQRLCDFLLGKLDDELKQQAKPQDLLRGTIDFVLFSLPQTRASGRKSSTNALNNKERGSNGYGHAPDKALRVTNGAFDLGSIDR